MACEVAGAQLGPPVCPVAAGATARVPAARPSVAAALATAEAGAADPSVLVAAEPMENFGVARYRLEDYADCLGNGGCYWADVDAQARRADFALEKVVAARKAGEKLAMVLDIDETSLSNYCEMKREDYGFLAAMFNEWEVSPAADIAVPGTLRLFNKAMAAGWRCFLLRGGPTSREKLRCEIWRRLGIRGRKV